MGIYISNIILYYAKTIVDRDSGNLYPIYIYKKIVVLASEPVGGRSRATELPCFQKGPIWTVVI